MELLFKPCEVFGPPSSVRHDVELIVGMLADDGVVDDPALVVQQNR